MNVTLKAKATLLASVVVAALLGVLGYVQHRDISEGLQSVVRDQQEALAVAVAEDLGEKLQLHLTVLTQAAAPIDAARLADATARNAYLHDAAAARALFDGVALVSLDGDALQSIPPAEGGARVNIRDREYFQRMLSSGGATISRPVQTRSGQGAGVMMLAPVRDAEGRLVAALAGGLRLDAPNLFGQLGSERIGRTGYFEVVTKGLNPLYVIHPDRTKLLAAAPGETAPASADPQDVVIRRDIPDVAWELRAILPAAEALGPIAHAQKRLWGQLGCLALVGALLTWLAMDRLLAPLSTLRRSMRVLRERPDAPVALQTDLPDERGDLAREFEALLHELGRRQAELSAVLEASPLGFFRADLDGRLAYVNDAYLIAHGLERHEAAQGWLKLVREEHREEAWRGWLEAVQQPRPFALVREMAVPSGRRLVLSVRSAPLIVNGLLEGHVGTVSNITERVDAERSLRWLTAIFDATPDFVVKTDARGGLTYLNPAARRALKIDADASLDGLGFAAFNTEETNRTFTETILPAVKARGVWIGETTVVDGESRVVPVSHMVIAHRDDQGRIAHFSAVMRDISDQHAARRSLTRQAATLRSVTEAIPAMVAVVGPDGRYRFVNGAFERWCGANRESIVGCTLPQVLGQVEYLRSRPWIERVQRGETVTFEKRYGQRGGDRHLSISYIPLWLDDGAVDGFVAVSQDITQHRLEEGRLLELSQRDPLTGLLNRAGFEEHLERCLGRGEGAELALLYIDLDHFKPINDEHGHPIGDRVLKMFAERVRNSVRPTDAVARLGGDEFAVVLSGVRDLASTHVVADKVVGLAREPFEIDALNLAIGASVGVAHGLKPGMGWRDFVARADTLLYEAKRAGRGRHASALH